MGHVRAGQKVVINEVEKAGFKYQGDIAAGKVVENFISVFTK